MTIEEFDKEIAIREAIFKRTEVILRQLEGQIALLKELRERESKKQTQ